MRGEMPLTFAIDEVRTDEKLAGILVDHAIGWSAADAFRPDDLLQSGRDFVKLIGGTIRLMRSISDHPQPVGPRHDGPDAALVFGIEHGQRRINPAHLARCIRKKTSGQNGNQKRLAQHHRGVMGSSTTGRSFFQPIFNFDRYHDFPLSALPW